MSAKKTARKLQPQDIAEMLNHLIYNECAESGVDPVVQTDTESEGECVIYFRGLVAENGIIVPAKKEDKNTNE